MSAAQPAEETPRYALHFTMDELDAIHRERRRAERMAEAGRAAAANRGADCGRPALAELFEAIEDAIGRVNRAMDAAEKRRDSAGAK